MKCCDSRPIGLDEGQQTEGGHNQTHCTGIFDVNLWIMVAHSAVLVLKYTRHHMDVHVHSLCTQFVYVHSFVHRPMYKQEMAAQ